MAISRPKGVEDTVARAQTISARLTKAIETVNDRLKAFEHALVTLGLGVSGGVDLPLKSDADDWSRDLVFGKINDEWKLYVQSGPLGGNDEHLNFSPLLNCSREVRLAAVDKLPELLEQLVRTAEHAAEQTEERAETLAKLLEVVSEDVPF